MNKRWKEILKFIMTVLSWTAFSLLLLIGGALLYYVINVQIYSSKGEEYAPPFELYTIISGSMEPKLKVYDVILNFKVNNPNKLNKGDIITFISTSPLNPGAIVTHRILEKIDTGAGIEFRTKGDNNSTPDAATVPYANVKGKTFMKIPQLGRIQFLLASKGGWFFAVLVPALGVIIYDILKLFKIVGVKKKIEDSSVKEAPNPQKIEQQKEWKQELKVADAYRLDKEYQKIEENFFKSKAILNEKVVDTSVASPKKSEDDIPIEPIITSEPIPEEEQIPEEPKVYKDDID